MGKYNEDLTGKTFGNLIVIKRVENQGEQPMWLCKCSCGNMKIARGHRLKNGETKHCGCKNMKDNVRKYKRLYHVWKSMKQRCYCKNNSKYKNYGARGIKVCEEWKNDYKKFEGWAYKHGYNEDAQYGECTIDRIDVNDNYEPSNCRFITIQEQCYNKTNLHYITYNNQTKCISEWAKYLGIKESTLRMRLVKYKWSVERALTKKCKGGNIVW